MLERNARKPVMMDGMASDAKVLAILAVDGYFANGSKKLECALSSVTIYEGSVTVGDSLTFIFY